MRGFEQFRVNELLLEPRCLSGTEYSEINSVRGLLELVDVLKAETNPPRSLIEIGCDTGISTEIWCMNFDRVVGVDPGIFLERHRVDPYGNFEYVNAHSPSALKQFRDGEFDVCYIDGDHNEEPCLADLTECMRIVRPDGWLAGHDWQHFTVQRAVRRALGEVRVRVFTDMSWLVHRV